MATGTSNNIYINIPDKSWIPGRLISSTSTQATVSLTGSGETMTVSLKDYPNDTLPLQNVDENGVLQVVEDMVDLAYLHEAAILYNLKHRHSKCVPYTRTGDIIIAVNPYQWINDLYTEKKQDEYAAELIWRTTASSTSKNNNNNNNNKSTTLPPHVYETSSLAYRGLACNARNQSILVSGESGAGKTETVKILMSHLASIQSGGSTRKGKNLIIQRVLDSNPLLEAFGNAKTVRNDNSSRFGKFTLLQFHCEDPVLASYSGKAIPSCLLAGSKCSTYLLEKSRIVSHTPEERTYHIFYQILAMRKDAKQNYWDGLTGKKNKDFKYVGHTTTTKIEGMTDAQQWKRTLDALKIIGVEEEQLHTLVRALCIVLQLGNLIIKPDPENMEDGSVIASADELSSLADLMGVDGDDVRKALTLRTVRAKNDVYSVPLNEHASTDCRDAFAKEIYACVFSWLVRTINDATCAENNYEDAEQVLEDEEENEGGGFKTIGLLDIFGFESFQVNRFEQLCINYANEKLQQKFTLDIFSSVQQEYEYEGIPMGEVNFLDNTEVLNLVEGRMGLIAVLNEECVRPKGNDISFVAKVRTLNKDYDCLILDNFHRDYEFGVKHYAGDVVYDANLFVKKNMDTMPADLLECASKSSNELVSVELEFAQAARMAPGGGGRRQGSLVSQTVSTKFRTQLASLMKTIGETRTLYIRCIKPNPDKKPKRMNLPNTSEQLRCAGVVAAVTISRSSFPNRLPHAFTLERFSCLGTKTLSLPPLTDDESCNEIYRKEVGTLLTRALRKFKDTDNNSGAYSLGKTRVYFRAGALEFLESQRMERLNDRAVLMQKIIRGFVAFRLFNRLRKACVLIQSRTRSYIASAKYRRKRAASIALQCSIRCALAVRMLVTLRRDYKATLIQTHWRMAVAITVRKTCIRAVVVIQAMLRGARQRPLYRAELAEATEAKNLESQVVALQRKLEEAETRRIEAEKRSAKVSEPEVKIVYRDAPAPPPPEQKSEDVPKPEEPESEPEPEPPEDAAATAAAAAAAAASSAALTAQQQTLIDESGKMLEYLRKEVYKLRSHNAQLRTDFDLLKDNNQRLMDANASAGASFQALNQHAKTLAKTNEKLQGALQSTKQQMSKMNLVQMELKEELKMKQATYIAEVHSRLQYQKAMGRIVEEVQARCLDDRLVDDILIMNDECENDFLAGSTGETPGRSQASPETREGNRTEDATTNPQRESKSKPQVNSPPMNNQRSIGDRFKSFLWGGANKNEPVSEDETDSEDEYDSESETDSEEEYEIRREMLTQVRKPGLNKLQAFSGGFREA